MRSPAIELNSASARSVTLIMACTALLALAGCEPPTDARTQTDEFAWARAALERNPTIEVIAADAQAKAFTVKVRRTGATQVIQMNQLGAAPISEFVAIALAATPAPTAAVAASAMAANQATTPAEPFAQAEPTTAADEAAPASASIEKNYTIQRSSAGQVKVSGPGVSIVSSGPAVAAVAEREQGQRTVDPVICEGKRMLHFDNRNIYVDGNAIVARGGCELYITNSHVISSGTAVVASDSIVHIANSTIEGSMASFDAGNGAKMYLRSSTFQGLPRRAERAVVQDQGGNTWR